MTKAEALANQVHSLRDDLEVARRQLADMAQAKGFAEGRLIGIMRRLEDRCSGLHFAGRLKDEKELRAFIKSLEPSPAEASDADSPHEGESGRVR